MNAAALHPAHGLPPGTRLAEFEVQAVLGVGGFGIVYRAYDHSLHRTVAIKEYMPSGLASRAGHAVVPRAEADAPLFGAGLRSFMAEARLLAQFDHPALVKVFRVWEQNRTAYLVMPLYQGMTLKEACAQMRTPPPEAWLRKLLWSVLQALELLHRHATVHRDISPDNIFLQDLGPPVLLDLGAARRALGEHQSQHTAVLKVNYAPIEQYADAQDMRQGPWSDVYALAAVVYGCLSQSPPMPATMRVLRDGMAPPAGVAAGLRETHGLVYSPVFVAALAQALAVHPDRRPQDLAAFRAQLQLQPAQDMDRFDWRAELGNAWEPSRRSFGQARAHAPTQTLEPIPRRADAGPAMPPRPVESTPPVAAVLPSPVPSPSPVSPAPAAGGWWLRAGAAVLIVGLLVAVGMVATPRDPQASARPPAVEPAPAAAQSATVATVPAPAPVPTPAQAPVSAPAVFATVPSRVAPSAELPPEPARMPLPPPTALREPVPPPRPAPRALSAEQICPDSNFFSRPMCLFRACQKAAYAAMPVCLENAQRLRDNERQIGP